jgi:hypothetical protein
MDVSFCWISEFLFTGHKRSSIKSGSSISSSTILLPMQEKAIINALIKSSSDGYHLGLTSLHYSWIAQVPW